MSIIGAAFATLLRLAIALFILPLWAIVGALVWFPLVIKMVFVAAAALFLELILQRQVLRAQIDFNRLFAFWINGVGVLIRFVVSGKSDGSTASLLGPPYDGPLAILADILKVTIMSVVFWVSAFVVAHEMGVTRSAALVDLQSTVGELLGSGAIGRAPHHEARLPTNGNADCTVNAPQANLRPAANAAATPITQLPFGAPVSFGRDPVPGDDWIAVVTPGGDQGFMARSLLDCRTHAP